MISPYLLQPLRSLREALKGAVEESEPEPERESTPESKTQAESETRTDHPYPAAAELHAARAHAIGAHAIGAKTSEGKAITSPQPADARPKPRAVRVGDF